MGDQSKSETRVRVLARLINTSCVERQHFGRASKRLVIIFYDRAMEMGPDVPVHLVVASSMLRDAEDEIL